MSKSGDVHEKPVNDELFSIIDRHLPVSMRSDFRKMMDGVNIPKPRRLKVEGYIKNIIEEHYDGEAW